MQGQPWQSYKPILDWGHIQPTERDSQIVGARVNVYAGTDEEYSTFMTSEAYHALKEYVQYNRLFEDPEFRTLLTKKLKALKL